MPKEGVLRVQKCCGYAPECRFVKVLVKMTKRFGPMGGGGCDPHIPPWLGPWNSLEIIVVNVIHQVFLVLIAETVYLRAMLTFFLEHRNQKFIIILTVHGPFQLHPVVILAHPRMATGMEEYSHLVKRSLTSAREVTS